MPTTAQQLATIRANQTSVIIPLLEKVVLHMAAVDDALANLASAVQEVSADLAKYAADLAAAGGTPQAVIDQINLMANNLKAAVTANQAP